jgi:UDP-N-acetyl-D-mannosaminouronate:lipid I N-acetyl-D-mannosaminouronosyltransferase
MNEAVSSVFSPLNGRVIPGFGVAINPEKVMKARIDDKLMKALLSATLPFADGIGVVLALRSKSARQVARIPGCEFWMALMQKAGQNQQPVFLVGAKPEVLVQVKAKLKHDWSVHVVGLQDGYFTDSQQDELINRIKVSGAKIVTVAMGSPAQELFIHQCRKFYPDAFYMGVGGTYDVFTGNVKRAPRWASKLNVEWLYRLISNPTRLARQVSLLKYILLFVNKKI